MKGDKELGKKASKRMLFEEEEVDGGLMKYKLTIKDIDMKDFGEVMFFSQIKWSFFCYLFISSRSPWLPRTWSARTRPPAPSRSYP